jgi:sugar phosphate isomerase/epimerase
MQRTKHTCRGLVALVLGTLVLSVMGQTGQADAADQAAWAPKLYGFCMEMPAVSNPSIAKQAEMLGRLGFDGVGYPLWLDENLDKNLKTLDDAGLKTFHLYTSVDLKPGGVPYDPRVEDSIRRLKGRPVTVCVLIRGFPPGDPRGEEPAVKVLRRLGDVAAEADVRISVYHHTNDWTESLIFALEIVKKANHPRVGANFNLCHWLKVDGDKDYGPVLRDNAQRIFAVTINGAQLGSDAWTGGLIQPLDRGDFDNRQLLKTLRQIGYQSPIGLMCYGIPDDTQEHLGRSMNVWKEWKAEWSNE